MSNPSASPGVRALHQRLRTIAPIMLGERVPPVAGDVLADVDRLLLGLLGVLCEEARADWSWLLLTGLTGRFPTSDEVHSMRRTAELESAESMIMPVLDRLLASVRADATQRQMRLVTDRVVVDVDFSARSEIHTGVQRTARSVARHWMVDHDVELVVWTDGEVCWRPPTDTERSRVLDWDGQRPDDDENADDVLVVAWDTTVVLPEIAKGTKVHRLSALAEHTGNRVSMIGYDCVPLTVPDVLAPEEPEAFSLYLSVVKHADVVTPISASAGTEFEGFRHALSAQGLAGPDVVLCSLGFDAPPPPTADVEPIAGDIPEVLVVGSHDLRKNHLAILHASEVLWAEGLEFSVCFLGSHTDVTTDIDDRINELLDQGRPLHTTADVDDETLWATYRRARFTMLPSLHEGFGLPVVESLAAGTPVIGSTFGSVADLAADGGIILVDPRDDEALIDAMRELLTDDALIHQLRAAATRRPIRTWSDYADDLWRVCVASGS